jgi:hypothetical protein
MTIEEYVNKEMCGSPYIKYARNVYSQNGEDGIIEKIFSELRITDGNVIEFGAWDGIYISNIYRLWKYGNFNGILIEGDKEKADKFSDPQGKAKMFNYFISPDKENENSIDNVLDKIGIDGVIALMSIDIDSCDYYVMASMEKYKPAVIIIETSNAFGYESIHKSYDSGCSMRAVWELAEEKNYTMVAYTANAILVRNDLLDNLKEFDRNITPQQMYLNEKQYITISSSDENGILGNIPYYLTESYINKINNETKP